MRRPWLVITANNIIEHKIQKGFTPNLAGNLEHTAQNTNIINQARIKQRLLLLPFLSEKYLYGLKPYIGTAVPSLPCLSSVTVICMQDVFNIF
jgi:hypothetical protein